MTNYSPSAILSPKSAAAVQSAAPALWRCPRPNPASLRPSMPATTRVGAPIASRVGIAGCRSGEANRRSAQPRPHQLLPTGSRMRIAAAPALWRCLARTPRACDLRCPPPPGSGRPLHHASASPGADREANRRRAQPRPHQLLPTGSRMRDCGGSCPLAVSSPEPREPATSMPATTRPAPIASRVGTRGADPARRTAARARLAPTSSSHRLSDGLWRLLPSGGVLARTLRARDLRCPPPPGSGRPLHHASHRRVPILCFIVILKHVIQTCVISNK